MARKQRCMWVVATIVLAGCASSPPHTIVEPRLDVEAIGQAIAKAIAAKIQGGPVTFRLDSAELLAGRSRCGTERRLHCDPDQHPALVTALSRELNAEIVADSAAMFCPQKRLPCDPNGEVSLVKVSLPVVDTTGITEVYVSMSLASDESVHENRFSVFLRCHATLCTVVGRQRILTA